MLRIIEENIQEYFAEIKQRKSQEYKDVYTTVDEILEDVRINKDEALKKYTMEFDKVNIDNFEVSQNEISDAYKTIDKDLLETLKAAKNNIQTYHAKQIRKSYQFKPDGKDIILGQLVNSIEKVGIYVPGGKAAYPSTVLMNAIPAKIAGVNEIIMITPPQRDGSIKDSILVAADIAGVDRIFKVGGAQGIGALIFKTIWR